MLRQTRTLRSVAALKKNQSLRKIISTPTISFFQQHHHRPLSTAPSVRILEVSPRDGLQNHPTTIPLATKLSLINRLAATHLPAIEATSFVSPKWVPQLADAPQLLAQILPLIQKPNPIDFPVLVPNLKGLEKALDAGAHEVVVFASATEAFSRANTNCSVEEALRRCRDVARDPRVRERGVRVRGVVSCIFSDPYEREPTDPRAVAKVVKAMLEMECYEVGLGDTLGVGTAADVSRLLEVLVGEGVDVARLAGHFHDTYGMAIGNVSRAYELGVRTFDASVAGLGGCPYAKGAKGNVASEDVVYMFEKSGVRTGVDLDALVQVGDWISTELGILNGSRAGAALVSKRAYSSTSASASASASLSTTTQKPAPTPSPPKTKRTPPQWLETNLSTPSYTVHRSQPGTALKITLTNPSKGNPLTTPLLTSLTTLLHSLASEPHPSTFHIVLCSTGPFFCTGMDLSSSTSSHTSDYYTQVHSLFAALESAPQTTIAVIDRPAFGGGVGLAFACDVRLVSAHASFSLSEVKLGLSPAVISRTVMREWGVGFFREAMLSGRSVSVGELKGLGGAVHGVAGDSEGLEELVEAYLEGLRTSAPRAAGRCKELVRVGWRDPGGREQEELVARTFREMLDEGSEGRYGVEMFRRRERRIDWGDFWRGRKKGREVKL